MVLLVTGGSRGIGAAVARLATRAGWTVCITYRSDAAAAAAVGAARVVQADVAVEADVVRAFETAAELGPLTGFVAGAGIVAPKARVDELTVERVERMLAVNVLGAIVGCREAVRRMSTRHGGGGGAIVLLGSAASRIGGSGEYVDYAASKAALDTLTVGLAKEVAAEGIRVNGVRAGIIRTDIHASGGEPGRVDRLGPGLPMQRGGEAIEVARAIVWLLSEDASYTTGSFVDVSGGR